MLSLPEKIFFLAAAAATIYVAWIEIRRLIKIIARGHGRPDWTLVRERFLANLVKAITLRPTFNIRLGVSILHGMVAWGFMYYLLVNLGDVYQAFFKGQIFLGSGWIGDIYRLGADLLTVAVLLGMAALMVRRFIFEPAELATRDQTLLHPKASAGIRRDSTIVAIFILLHVGFRFLGESFKLAAEGMDAWQPFASTVSRLWGGWGDLPLTIGQHVGFWMAIGLIMLFIPYFPKSKHIHLFFAPINFLLSPERKSIGELGKINFNDESIEQFGASRLEDLQYEQLLDAYACIMCNRCQQVCPAYNTGKLLSPAALEINKRYFLNQEGSRLAAGEASSQTLLEFAIPAEAVWACTACGACNNICPVGNEPMRDIMDIRRSLVLMENDFPSQFQNAFRGMERNSNPWNISSSERMKWAEGLKVPTIEQNPEPEVLWWVGCAPATDVRAQKTAQAFAKILNRAGISYAVLGKQEQCTGDSARRAGNEYLFFEMASANVEILNEVAPKRIVTTCPHCLHTLKNEYPAFGGQYEVIHHTDLINEMFDTGRLQAVSGKERPAVTLHDPCYLGRHNGKVDGPRIMLSNVGVINKEMPQAGMQSFCCGAGGAQFWKEEEHGEEPVNEHRFKQAVATGVDTVAVGCPFCMVMMTDAGKNLGSTVAVKDLAEIVLESLEE